MAFIFALCLRFVVILYVIKNNVLVQQYLLKDIQTKTSQIPGSTTCCWGQSFGRLIFVRRQIRQSDY